MGKKIFMIAGPNGSGKTTTALKVLPELGVLEFLNADEIAKGLSPLNPDSVPVAASKIMLKRFFGLLRANESFGFETTASPKNYIKQKKWICDSSILSVARQSGIGYKTSC